MLNKVFIWNIGPLGNSNTLYNTISVVNEQFLKEQNSELDVSFFKFGVYGVSKYRDQVVDTRFPTQLQNASKARIVENTQHFLERYEMEDKEVDFFYDIYDRIIGFKVAGDKYIRTVTNEDSISDLDELLKVFEKKYKESGVLDFYYSLCGVLCRFSNKYPTQFITIFLLNILQDKNFVDESVWFVQPGFNKTSTIFTVAYLYDKLFCPITGQNIEFSFVNIEKVVEDVLDNEILYGFSCTDMGKILKSLNIAIDAKEDFSVDFQYYVNNQEYLHTKHDIIYITVPENIPFPGLTLEKEFVKETLVDTREKTLLMELSYRPSDKSIGYMELILEDMLKPLIDKVNILVSE